MTQSSYPWDGISTGDKGPYSASQVADFLEALGGGSALASRSGVLWNSDPTLPRRGLEVVANSPVAANVVVRPGMAVVDGRIYISTADEVLSIAANGSGNTRIDTIILRKTLASQEVRLAVLQGTPAASPVPPTLTNTAATFEIPLANVTVVTGFSTLADSTIAPVASPRDGQDALYHIVLNNTAGSLVTGDVVVWDSTADRAVKTTTTHNDPNVAGVVVGTIAAGGYGRVLYKGIGFVNALGGRAKGDILFADTTAKRARADFIPSLGLTVSRFNAFARVLTASTGTGLVLCYVDCPLVIAPILARASGTGSTSSASFVSLQSHTVTPTGNPINVEVTVAYRDSGVAVPSFNLLSLAIFEAGVNVSDMWNADTGGTRVAWNPCNEMRRTIQLTLRRREPLPIGTSIAISLRWSVNSGTVTAEWYSFSVYESAS